MSDMKITPIPNFTMGMYQTPTVCSICGAMAVTNGDFKGILCEHLSKPSTFEIGKVTMDRTNVKK